MNWIDLFTALWIFMPAGLANATPVFAKKIPGLNKLNYPLDFNKSLNGIRIFGDHKTFRGLVTGIIIAIVVTFLQQRIYFNNEWLRNNVFLDYSQINPIFFGFLSATGALLGDAFKSFFKRRTNIKPGDPWFPFDQTDYIIGGLLFLSPFLNQYPLMYVYIPIIYFLLHLISSFLGYLLKLKDKPI